MQVQPPTPPLTDLKALLSQMAPRLVPGEFVIVALPAGSLPPPTLETLGVFREAEALTVICRREAALAHELSFDGTYRQITLEVHSSLHAVGFLAAISAALSQAGIPCNVVSAFYHDHLFVPADLAERAMTALADLSASVRSS